MLQTTSSENYESHNWLLNSELAQIQAYKLTIYLCIQTSKKTNKTKNKTAPTLPLLSWILKWLQINPDSSSK